MKKLFLLLAVLSSTFTISSCASPGESGRENPSLTTYDNTPDNPMVNSRAASSEEFPQENQL